ncbi:LysM peptidoglycan-binding domain-containing protein [Candidatus Beckwithbacteria bacterium]|nr:LysM peptidoglycan-binding domain-containing protein [Candidatus Beckwithbacteria bacterium]
MDTTSKTLELRVKDFLKQISLNEATISTILGGLVVVIVALLIYNYVKQLGTEAQISNTAASTSNEELIKLQAGSNTYKVQAGEGLWQIAEKEYGNGEFWTDIAQANLLDNPDFVEPGQILVLPQVDKSKFGQILSASSTQKLTSNTYTVQLGDDLYNISIKAYGTGERFMEIAQANNLASPDYLEVGQVLTIPRN